MTQNNRPFKCYLTDRFYNTLLAWRSDLCSRSGDLAQLRRYATPKQALLDPNVIRLIHHLRAKGVFIKDCDFEKLATIAIVTALCREDVRKHSLGELLAGSDNNPVVSELRFRRLLEAGLQSELLTQLRRILGSLSYAFPIRDTARLIWCWPDEPDSADDSRHKLAMDYYQ